MPLKGGIVIPLPEEEWHVLDMMKGDMWLQPFCMGYPTIIINFIPFLHHTQSNFYPP